MTACSAGLTVFASGMEARRGETPVPRWLDAQRDSPAPRSGETPRPTGTWQNSGSHADDTEPAATWPVRRSPRDKCFKPPRKSSPDSSITVQRVDISLNLD